MLETTTESYTDYVKVDLNRKLTPIYQSIDDMLTRLEEFETILTVVQQERCNAVGLTGSLTQASDSLGELKQLCARIDAFEKLIEHVKSNVDAVEKRVEAAEEKLGLTDNVSKIKNFLLSPLFQSPSASVHESGNNEEVDVFSTENYFNNEAQETRREP